MVDTLEERIHREARFASDVSHELRTPIAAMHSAANVVRRRLSNPERRSPPSTSWRPRSTDSTGW